jgi:hypothetical protein
MTSAALGFAAGLTLCLAVDCLAEDMKVREQFAGTVVGFELGGAYDNVTLTITGPSDVDARVFSKRGAPSFDLRSIAPIQDGTYTYQLTAATQERTKRRNPLDNGRDRPAAGEERTAVATSGTFHVRNGVIVRREVPERPRRRDQN